VEQVTITPDDGEKSTQKKMGTLKKPYGNKKEEGGKGIV